MIHDYVSLALSIGIGIVSLYALLDARHNRPQSLALGIGLTFIALAQLSEALAWSNAARKSFEILACLLMILYW